MADTFNQKQLTKAPGNAVVMSPKALKDNQSYDYKLDIFSYGCLILYVFTRQWPIFAHQHKQNDLKLFDFVQELDRRATDIKAIPSGNPSFPFSKSCLENDPKKWPTISDAIIRAQCTVSTLPPLKNIMVNDNSSRTEKVNQLRQISELEQEKEQVETTGWGQGSTICEWFYKAWTIQWSGWC